MRKRARKQGIDVKQRGREDLEIDGGARAAKGIVQLAPAGVSTADVVDRLLQEGILADRLAVVIRSEDNDTVCVLPSPDRERLERVDPRFKGKQVVLMTEEQACEFGIL